MKVRNKSLFNKKIKCAHCESGFKVKTEKGVRRYICSSYDNYSSCKRIPIEEEFLKGLIQRRHNREMTDEEIREVVEYIEIEDKLLLEIHLKDQESILLSRKHIRL